MPDRPLIVLPAPARASRSNLHGGSEKFVAPSVSRQIKRIGPRIKELQEYFQNKAIEFRTSAAGQIPGEVIVFETIGSIENFVKAAQRIKGFEFLTELDIEDIEPDEDFSSSKNSLLSGRLFLVMSNQEALKQLLSLWKDFRNGVKMKRGLKPFQNVFAHLRDVRPWSVKDRILETGIREYWQEASVGQDDVAIPFEIELWYRDQPHVRALAFASVRTIVEHLNGEIISECEIPEIAYQAAIASLPVSQIRNLTELQNSQLLGESSIMFFRPSGQMVVAPHPDEEVTVSEIRYSPILPFGEPTVALFDGLPLENHNMLVGRLRVDDPDDYGHNYPASDRHHGTAMASILAHGDLNASRTSLTRPIYTRPILRPEAPSWVTLREERIPFGVNQIDLTHRAVRRLFEGEGSVSAVAPNVKIINLSIGDPDQPFNSAVSAWGRLLDWLSYTYNILFCVSAGNTPTINLNVSRTAFSTMSAIDREAEVLRGIHDELRHRRILSPSDSINSLTIGAWHSDSSFLPSDPNRLNIFVSEPMPSPVNRLGSGLRNSIKPDILLPGGRQLFQGVLVNPSTNLVLEASQSSLPPGVLAASPGGLAGQVNATKHSRGTSNATALAVRSGAFLYEQLLSIQQDPEGSHLTDDYSAVLLKSMLVHNAAWGSAYERLKSALKSASMREDKFKRIASRFLGYGFVEPMESLTSEDYRATMIGFGKLTHGSADEYRIPLPPSLSGLLGSRRVTVTLAWNSPVNPKHRNYRRAALWFDIEKEKLSVEYEDAERKSAKNGTIQHEIFEGERAVPISDDGTMLIKVNCREDAGTLGGNYIKYGLIVTIEVAEELHVPVYDEIAARIRPAVPIAAGSP